MVDGRPVVLFFALSYAAALAFQLDRATQNGEFVPRDPAPCLADRATAGDDVDGDRLRALLALPPCWWTATVDDLAGIDGLGERGAREAFAARERGVAPTRAALVAHGMSERRAAVVAAGVAVGCGFDDPPRSRPQVD